MICNNCPAKVSTGCFLTKKKVSRCDRDRAEINRIIKILLLNRELDEIATRYIVDKDKKAKEEWWDKLKEGSK